MNIEKLNKTSFNIAFVLLFVFLCLYNNLKSQDKLICNLTDSTKLNHPFDETDFPVLIFDSELPLDIVSSYEILKLDSNIKVKNSKYYVLLRPESHVITVSLLANKTIYKDINFGQNISNTFPSLKRGNVFKFDVKIEKSLLTVDCTDDKKNDGANDFGVEGKVEDAMIILISKPPQLKYEILTKDPKSKKIPKDEGQINVYVSAKNPGITIRKDGFVDRNLEFVGLEPKSTRYFYVIADFENSIQNDKKIIEMQEKLKLAEEEKKQLEEEKKKWEKESTVNKRNENDKKVQEMIEKLRIAEEEKRRIEVEKNRMLEEKQRIEEEKKKIEQENIKNLKLAEENRRKIKPTYQFTGENIENISEKAREDAKANYHANHCGSGWVSTTTMVFSPLVGVVPAAMCAAFKPRDKNLDYPNSSLMNHPDYNRTYIKEAKRIKKKKIWRAFGISSVAWVGMVYLLSQ